MTNERKVLIAIDGSESAMGSVRYISQFHDPEKTKITLIHIMTDLPEAVEDLKNMPTFEVPFIETDAWHIQMRAGIEMKMKDAIEIFVNAGFDKNAIEIKILKRAEGVAKDIIDESAKGYDAVVVGRRGMNDPTDIIVGATAYRMMSGIPHLPVVVVGDNPDPNHVLIGFDGSENAFKAVECVCSLMPKTGRKVMLCHVAQKIQNSGEDQKVFSDDQEKSWQERSRHQMMALMKEATKRLVEAGFDPGLIVSEILEGKVSRAVAIAKTAEMKGYGTIVTGRRGLSVIKDFLMGRVSMKVLHRAHEMAVWIV
ncbi:MAG: universal stress protein [Desulfosalsimonadaceae bacterium]